MGVTNAITFDLEHWHSATLLSDSVRNPPDLIADSLEFVLDLLTRTDVTATFFVVGEVALEYPGLVGKIADAGHEIASHGHTHTPLTELDAASFRNELRESTVAISDAAGSQPVGFRAPNFSVLPETAWAFEELRNRGFQYDSSVFPLRTPMYGVSDAPRHPYPVVEASPFADSPPGGEQHLTELPLAIHPWCPVPVAGGFYARMLPYRVLKHGLTQLNNRGVPATLYFHPWEFNPAVKEEIDASDVSRSARQISTVGMGGIERKLERLLAAFQFDTAQTVATDEV